MVPMATWLCYPFSFTNVYSKLLPFIFTSEKMLELLTRSCCCVFAAPCR